MIDLSPDAWAAVGIAIATTGSTVAAVWIAHIKTSRQASSIAAHVEDVRQLALPTGNGFAREVTEALDELKRGQERIERRQETDAVTARKAAELLAQHLGDHARAQINRSPREPT